MATTRLMPLHIGKGRTVGTAIERIIDYVENPDKTDYGRLITREALNKSPAADAADLLSQLCSLKIGKYETPENSV